MRNRLRPAMIGLVDVNNCFVSCERVFDRSLVGRPVAVLSNNDGCCVSRSNEFKALGIAMGTPYFQLKDREASGEIVFRSSNYELYGDMSRRFISVLRDEALEVEQYSIDEAFIRPPHLADGDFVAFGRRLRAKILRWTGLPCGIGFAPTKTLAKIANEKAKKTPGGVWQLPDDPTGTLAALAAGDVWGVGRNLALQLRAEQVFTALDLRNAPDDLLRSVGGVTLLRTAMELRGENCLDERDYDADPESITCSRSFGEWVTTKEGIVESVASFAAQAAEKLRRHAMLASGCNVFAQVHRTGGGGEFAERTVVFAAPTDATNEIIAAVRPAAEALFVPGLGYRKTGVVFFGLEKAGAARQLDLFAPVTAAESSPLYRAVDRLNAKYGAGRVFSAAEGVGAKAWAAKRSKLSRRATTSWDELPVVR